MKRALLLSLSLLVPACGGDPPSPPAPQATDVPCKAGPMPCSGGCACNTNIDLCEPIPAGTAGHVPGTVCS